MCAAITYVDKQRFPFSDVQRVFFSEISNHAKINGAKDVPLIAGNNHDKINGAKDVSLIAGNIFLLDCPNAFCC